MRRSAVRAGVMVLVVSAATGCAGAEGDSGEPTPSASSIAVPEGPTPEADAPSAETTPTPEPSPSTREGIAAIMDWAADAEWSYAPGGTGMPMTVQLAEGAASDAPGGGDFELGWGVEADADADGVLDAALPITRVLGDTTEVLWYVWLGVEHAAEGEPTAIQVPYPIARDVACGDRVRSVEATGTGFRIDEALRMPWTDAQLACEDEGSGVQLREVEIVEVEGARYPVQTSPVAAWGGVCPRAPELDGFEETGFELRVGPPQTAALAVDPARTFWVFALDPVPLLADGDLAFLGFNQDIAGDAAVKQHCAFYD